MKNCETCGQALETAYPFRFCPNCLFGEDEAGCALPEPFATLPSMGTMPGRSVRPDFFKKYDVLEKVDGGGQGDVWEVWDFEFRRCVAMKRLSARTVNSDAAVSRSSAEAQIASQLEHPGILPIFDVGLDPDGRPFYTTQLLPPRTLADVWRQVHQPGEEGWTQPRALELLIRVCEVMAYAHARGVTHRDLKPANILVGPFGDVRVIDWGSAHLRAEARKAFGNGSASPTRPPVETDRQDMIIDGSGSAHATADTGLPVTTLFVPPEVLIDGSTEPSPETDVYSVGVMLYELLAGRHPYSLPSGRLPPESELREAIAAGPPTSVRSINPHVSRDLAAICGKAMAYSKTDRYRTMEALGADLRAVIEIRAVSARNPGVVLRLEKWLMRNRSSVLLMLLILAVAGVGFAVAHGLQMERDGAQQMASLERAERAARSGRWREALRHWQDAESAGFPDSIHLALRRAEAWTVLGSAQGAQAELGPLVDRSDLGERRGSVLLRIGERELFDGLTFQTGVQRVRDALAAGLTGADQAFALGLLADSTPRALQEFRRALQFEPYHHGAHRHSLGLEYLLGRHEELDAHARVFRVFFPDDPSPGFLEAAECATHRGLPEAEEVLNQLRGAADPEMLQRLNAGFAVLAAASEFFRLESILGGDRGGQALGSQVEEYLSGLPLSQETGGGLRLPSAVRLPRLPCLGEYLAGVEAIRALALPGFADPQLAIEKVRAGWRRHPEAWLPALTAALLDNWHPSQGPRTPKLLWLQAELFQLAADSGSVIPTLGSWARYRAAMTQFELARSGHTNAVVAREDCLRNGRRIAQAAGPSAAECAAYFEMALALGDHDLARGLLGQWERQQPAELRESGHRIRLEIASGSFGTAINLIDTVLREQPTNHWARQQRGIVSNQLEELMRLHVGNPRSPTSSPDRISNQP